MLKTFFSIFLLFILSSAAFGQIEVSNAIDIGYPYVNNSYNTKLNYGQITAGLRFGVSYKPTDVQFFPTLYLSFGRTRMPLQQYEDNVMGVDMNYLNLLLNGNLVMVVNQKDNTLYAIGGIGFTRLNPKGLSLAGTNAGAEKVTLDSTNNITKVFPAMEIGLEYVYGSAVNSKIYISMGLNFEYAIFLTGNNNYYASVLDAQNNHLKLHGALDGYAIIPTFSLCLHYMLGKDLIFWHKKE